MFAVFINASNLMLAIFSNQIFMKTRFTPYYIELIFDAALKSFWRKNALKKFVRGCKVSENFISTWGEEERKRDFLDRLFEKLKSTDNG